MEANILVSQAGCEELSALADTVLAGHRHCLAGQAHLSMLGCSLMRSTCAEAAALVRVAAWLGIGTSSVQAGWVHATRPASGLLHGDLHRELNKMPDWCRKLYIQGCARAWLVDAVRDFRAATAKGQLCEWRPMPSVQPPWFFKSGIFSLNMVPSLDELGRLASPGHQPAVASFS